MSQHIKTWQERAEEAFKADAALLEQKKTETVMDAMRAYIADLEAALARRPDSGKVAEVVRAIHSAVLEQEPDSSMSKDKQFAYRAGVHCSAAVVSRFAPAADSAATEQTADKPAFTYQANAGPVPGDHPIDRLIAAAPLPMFPPAKRSDSAAEPRVDTPELRRLVNAYREACDGVQGHAIADWRRLVAHIETLCAAAPASADVGELPELQRAALLDIKRHFERMLNELKPKQTTSFGPRAEGYQYAEAPDWWLRQRIASIDAVLAQASSAALPKKDAAPPPGSCSCRRCINARGDTIAGWPREFCEMILCTTCGNKRCPHANDHRNACTGSNEPGQPGSAYPAALSASAEKGGE